MAAGTGRKSSGDRAPREVEALEFEILVRAPTAHLAALALIALQALSGRTILVRLGWSRDLGALETLGFGWATGFALSSGVLLVLALSNGLVPIAVCALQAALFGLSLGPGLSFARARAGAHATSLAIRRLSAAGWKRISLVLALVLVVLVWIFPLAVQTLLPNSDWDSALYQLPLADRYLAGEVFGHDPYFPAYAFPGAVNLLYAALLSLRLEAAIIPLNFYATLLSLALAVSLAERLGGRTAAVFAGLVLASVPLFWQVGVDPRIDSFLCLSITLALYALYLFAYRRDDQSLFLLALALGAALGCKYTAVFYAGLFAAVAVALAVRRTNTNTARTAGVCLLLLAVPNGAWYAANTVIHGDPLYPMLRGHYVLTGDGDRRYLASEPEPLAAGLLDAPAQRRLTDLADAAASPPPTHLFDVPDLLANPDDYAVKPNHGVGPLPFLSLLLPLHLLLSWWKPSEQQRLATLALFGAAWGSYLLLGSQTNLLRYVLPAFPAFAAIAGLVVACTPLFAVRAGIALLAGLLLFSSRQAEVARLLVLRADEALALPTEGLAGFARDARIEWLSHVGYNFTPAMALATKQINAFVRSGRMQRDDLVLMVGEGKGHLLDCRYLPDGSWFAHRFLAEFENAGLHDAVLLERLRNRGVTHVLYNHGYFEDWVVTQTRTDRSRLARTLVHVERFLADQGQTIFRGPGMQLVRLREPAGTATTVKP